MNAVIANMLAIFSVAPIIAFPAIVIFCHFSCRSCERRREEARVEMQLRIGQELNREQRVRAEANAWLMLVTRQQRWRF